MHCFQHTHLYHYNKNETPTCINHKLTSGWWGVTTRSARLWRCHICKILLVYWSCWLKHVFPLLCYMVRENRPKGWMKPKPNQNCRPLQNTDTQLHCSTLIRPRQPRDHQPVHEQWLCWCHRYFPQAVRNTITLHCGDGCAPPQTTTRQPPTLLSSLSLIHAWTSLWGVTEIMIGNLKEFTRQWCSPRQVMPHIHKEQLRLNWLNVVRLKKMHPLWQNIDW